MFKCPNCDAELTVVLDDSGDVGELLAKVNDAALTKDFEIKFVADLRERHAKWGSRIKMSPKQMGVLRRIAKGGNGRQPDDIDPPF